MAALSLQGWRLRIQNHACYIHAATRSCGLKVHFLCCAAAMFTWTQSAVTSWIMGAAFVVLGYMKAVHTHAVFVSRFQQYVSIMGGSAPLSSYSPGAQIRRRMSSQWTHTVDGSASGRGSIYALGRGV